MSSRTTARSSARLALIVGLSLVAALAVIVVALVVTRPPAPVADPDVPLVTSTTHLLATGESDVVLVEFGDFECPACAAFEPFVAELREEYAGRVTIAFRHLPLAQHAHALDAALAAEAAGRQGRFTEMHDALYAGQVDWASAADAPAVFREYARGLGLDLARYDADVASPELRAVVEADAAAAVQLGVRSTPSFFLDGRLLELRSYGDLRTAVEDALTNR